VRTSSVLRATVAGSSSSDRSACRVSRNPHEEDDVTVLQLELQVREYAAWKDAFDSDPADRAGSGVHRHRILRSADDPNLVVVHLEFERAEAAERMRAALKELWERIGTDMFESADARVLEEAEAVDYDNR
jgi:hypothetical protein